MKFFTKKGFWNKLIVVLLVLIIFSAIIPTHASYAASDFGGKLLKPIVDFLLAVADAVVDFIHHSLFGMEIATIKIDLDNPVLQIISVVLVFIGALILIAVTLVIIATGVGAIIAALGLTVGSISAVTVGAIAIGGATIAAVVFNSNAFRARSSITNIFNITRRNF